MAESDSSVVRFEIPCESTDPMYQDLVKKAKSSSAREMQPLGNMVVEIRMLPKDPGESPKSK